MNRAGRTGVSLLLWGIAVVLLVTIAGAFLLLGRSAARRGDEEPALDPEPYREKIEAIEATLYGPNPEFAGDLAIELALEFQRDRRGPGRNRAATELFEFGALCGTFEDAGYGRIDPVDLRLEWVRVRDSVFTPASWFRRETDDEGRPAPLPLDPSRIAALRRSLDEAEALLEAARAEGMAFGEVGVDVPAVTSSEERVDLERRWSAWAEVWERRVRDAGGRVNPVAPGSPVDLVDAAQEIRYALHELALLTTTESEHLDVPMKSEREQRIEAAAAALSKARESLRRVER